MLSIDHPIASLTHSSLSHILPPSWPKLWLFFWSLFGYGIIHFEILHATKQNFETLIKCIRTSLVVQWLRICLPVQKTWIPSLVQEDSTLCRATKPMCHNYRAHILEHVLHKRSHCSEKLVYHN